MTAKRYALWSSLIALAAAALLILLIPRGGVEMLFSLLGWSIMALSGIAGGTWMTVQHGRQGAGFLVALGVCMLARMAAAVAGALVVLSIDRAAVWAYLAGLGAGYLSLQALEVGWFLRRSRIEALASMRDGQIPATPGQ